MNRDAVSVRQQSFEGGAHDVPVSAIARRLEMRLILGEQTDLKPVEAKSDVLF